MIRSNYVRSGLAVLTILISVAGCKSTSNPAALQGTGSSTLTGTVTSLSADGIRTLDSSGVSVTLEGTSFATTTDHTGSFTIDGIPAGVYNIIFTKSGFDSTIYPGHHLLGEGTDVFNDPIIFQNSSDSIIFDQVTVTLNDSVGGSRDSGIINRDSEQLATFDVHAHVTGPDSVFQSQIVIQINADTDFVQLASQNFPARQQALHYRLTYNITPNVRHSRLKSGDTVRFIASYMIIPYSHAGVQSQYYHFPTQNKTAVVRYDYIVP